jgi:hypothetical protein
MNDLALNRLIGALAAAFILFSPCADAGQDNPDGDSGISPLFASHAPLEVTIEAPLTTLMDERPEDKYLEGTFSYVGDDGTEHMFDLKLRTRGKFRRQARVCNFAPIRLNFRKKQLADTMFAGQDKLKLVTHCQQNKPIYEQFVLREYLAYRIFQVMTDKSFSARLLHINYIDTERGKSRTKYGFVIEDDDDVAKRNGMKSMNIGDVTYDDLDPQQQNLVYVFQYMIGNTDFSLINGPEFSNCCHNSRLLSANGSPPFTPLPYDFDFSGLVKATYAKPNKRFRLASVRSRLYRGNCGNNDLLPDTFRYFIEKKDAVYAIVDELDMFTANTRRSVIRYLDSFYDDITRPEAKAEEFTDKCTPGGTT